MKRLYKLLDSTLFIATFGYATVTVDGYTYLENQTDHDSIQVYLKGPNLQNCLTQAMQRTVLMKQQELVENHEIT